MISDHTLHHRQQISSSQERKSKCIRSKGHKVRLRTTGSSLGQMRIVDRLVTKSDYARAQRSSSGVARLVDFVYVNRSGARSFKFWDAGDAARKSRRVLLIVSLYFDAFSRLLLFYVSDNISLHWSDYCWTLSSQQNLSLTLSTSVYTILH